MISAGRRGGDDSDRRSGVDDRAMVLNIYSAERNCSSHCGVAYRTDRTGT
jgi:hypothetical protein